MSKQPASTECKYVSFRQFGGEVASGSILGKKVAPLGVPQKKVGEDIAKQSQEWKGIKVTVNLAIQSGQYTITISPSATALILKQLNEPLRDRKKVKNIKHSGNISLEQVIEITRTLRELKQYNLAHTFSGTLKEVLGTCNAVGCTVMKLKPTQVQEMIDQGAIDVPDY